MKTEEDYFEKLIRNTLLKPEILKGIKIGEDENKIYTVLGYIQKESEQE